MPRRISRRALCDGYLELMRDLYQPDAYFRRLDALYLDGDPVPPSARMRYLRRHPWRWLKAQSWSVVEAAVIIIQLMRGVPDETLRRDYRARLWNVIRRRPGPRLLRTYAIKCALHLHFDRLIAPMLAENAGLSGETETNKERTELLLTKLAVTGGS